MTPPTPSAGLVRLVARLTAYAYPSDFRRRYGRAFADVGEHLWHRERQRRSGAGATVHALATLIIDVVHGAPLVWMTATDTARRSRPADTPALRGWLDGGRHDLKLAVRAAFRRPAFSAAVAATLGLGIGVSAAAFDALDRTVIRPLPFHDSGRLVLLSLRDPHTGFWTSPDLATLDAWRARATQLQGIEVMRGATTVLHGDGGAERLDVLGISGGLPGLIGLQPLLGRPLLPSDGEPSAAPVVMVTEQTWRARFGGDPAIVGRALSLGATPKPTIVVGVWPAGARLEMDDTPAFMNVLPKGREYGRGHLVTMIARMTPAATEATVEAELLALTATQAAARSGEVQNVPDVSGPAALYLGDAYIRGIWVVFAGAIALLIVAVINAGHLLFGRAVGREHELGVRLALGASNGRLLRLFLFEALVIVAGGVAAGVLVMLSLERLIVRIEPRLFTPLDGAGLQGRAIAFLAASAAIATLACALAPLLRSRARDIRRSLEGASARSTRRESRALRGFVAAQAALAVLLVCGACVTGRSFLNLLAVDAGMAIEQLAAISVAAPAARFPTPEGRAAYLSRVEEALRTLPGVTGVTTSGMPLLSTSIQDGALYLEGESKPMPDDGSMSALASVPLNYFDVTGMRLIAGRGFQPDDGTGVAVVNESFAASRGGNVLGRRVYTPRGRSSFEIVGVVADVKVFGVADDRRRFGIYFPELKTSHEFARFFVRSNDPDATIREARGRIASIDRTIPMFAPETGAQVLRRQTVRHRLVALLTGGLAFLAFALAVSGVYGAASMGVARRTREIGVRMALGATREQVSRAVLSVNLRPVVTGGAVGVGAAWALLPHIEVLLYRVRPSDPAATAAGLLIVVIAAAAASWVPALRASRIDPLVTLRNN